GEPFGIGARVELGAMDSGQLQAKQVHAGGDAGAAGDHDGLAVQHAELPVEAVQVLWGSEAVFEEVVSGGRVDGSRNAAGLANHRIDFASPALRRSSVEQVDLVACQQLPQLQRFDA